LNNIKKKKLKLTEKISFGKVWFGFRNSGRKKKWYNLETLKNPDNQSIRNQKKTICKMKNESS
jgi:hypothetical protein